MLTKKWLIIASAITITACGNSNKDGVAPDVISPVATLPELNSMTVPMGALVPQQGNSFEQHLKNGVYLRSQSDLKINFADGVETASESSSTQFSGTTTQEQGVDEGDKIKYDGEYLFIATQQAQIHILEDDTAENDNTANTSIRIMQRQDQGVMTELNNVTINEEATNINSLYLSDNKLAVLSDIYSYNIAAMGFSELFFPFEQHFNLSLVDVAVPQTPSTSLSYTIDGSIINSRRIGDVLYVVSSYSASLDDIIYASTDEEKLAQYNKVMEADINDLLPKYKDSAGNEFNLVEVENCYLPEDSTELDGFDGIVTLTAINLKNPSAFNSVCINAQVQGLYASQNSLYLYGTEYQYLEGSSTESSVVHKFNLESNTINYRASGNLDGRFNWNLSNLRFSEQGDYLRVVTTSGDSSSGFQHKLNVLAEDGDNLTIVTQLPNDINTKLIGKVSDDGKVREDIQSVRFYQKQAYIVTFENTDPLYVIDLKDNLNPSIIGELEIPGYSAYLHPISDNLLLGIGQNVNPNTDSTETGNGSPIVEGAKVSLFDISDMSSPKEIHSIVYENAYTPVEYDYHALSFLKMPDNSTRFAIPIERWLSETREDDEGQKYDAWFNENELALFEVSSTTANAMLNDIGAIKALNQKDPSFNASSWDDRSIFHGDDIYYIHGYQVWQSVWQDINQVTGPF